MPKDLIKKKRTLYKAGVADGIAAALERERAASGRKAKKENYDLARRRLFLLVNMEVEAKEESINSRVFRSELIRIVKLDSEMERVLNIMGKSVGIGCLEDRFFRAIRSDLKGFATAIGAMPK